MYLHGTIKHMVNILHTYKKSSQNACDACLTIDWVVSTSKDPDKPKIASSYDAIFG